MNYIKHLTGFFNRIAIEKTLYPTHISLYLTLFQCWNVNRFKNPIIISRDEIMKGSKIASKATYHKCIKELQRLGFLDYHPSYNPYSGTQVFIHNLATEGKEKTVIEPITSSNNSRTLLKKEPSHLKNNPMSSKATEQVDEQAYIYNNKTFKNNKNIAIEPEFEIFNNNTFLESQEKEMFFAFDDTDEKKHTEKDRKKSAAKKEKTVTASVSSKAVPMDEKPSLELVKEYFKFQESSEFEAERYFNYYSSNGWLIGGKTKMKDWKASARNWMLNTSKFKVNTPQINPIKEQTRAQNLHTTTDKNYAEPL
jgi:hypothetical protein